MNANATQTALPKAILSRSPARLWVRHYLDRVGTVDDLSQIVWEVCLDPKHKGRLEREEYWSLSGYVAARLRKEIGKVRKEFGFGGTGKSQQHATHQHTPDSDPFTEYLDPKDAEMVRDRFYAQGDREAMRALRIKYGVRSTSALRMRALRAVNAAKRKYSDSH